MPRRRASADDPMRIHFYHIDGLGREDHDGGAIFDRKTLAALRHGGAEVEEVPVVRRRAIRVPTWAGRIDTARLRAASDETGCRTILSHEATFALAHEIKADALIVHNYFSRFRFPGRRDLELYYRLGAQRYYGRAFDQAATIFFLSYRERDLAEEDFPQIRGRTIVIPPPPAPMSLAPRRLDVVHISGSEGWLPKRLSRLSDDDAARFAGAGFTIEDFGPRPSPAFGLITDRFTVGFKLKLMQMIACRDIIASRADIAHEMEQIAPDYPFWRHVASAGEALEFFGDIRSRLTVEAIDAAFDTATPHFRVPTWNDHGGTILNAIAAR